MLYLGTYVFSTSTSKIHCSLIDFRRDAQKSASLLRLGLLMALTMTLHNMPEGFAVAFSAYTPLGPIMATAIAMHNIPEGIIIAAPIYAATGSRWKAIALATASVRLTTSRVLASIDTEILSAEFQPWSSLRIYLSMNEIAYD